MQKTHDLKFRCPNCHTSIGFSVFDLNKQPGTIECPCGRCYAFGDATLKRQIEKFEALCRQIADSEEILSNAAIGVHVAGQDIKIPYRILLTRLNSRLDLTVGHETLTIEFRSEPCKDLTAR